MDTIAKIVESIAARLTDRGASEEDAREMAESRRDRIIVDSDGVVCAMDRGGRVIRSTGAAEYLTAELVGGAPAGVWARRRVSDEAITEKRQREHFYRLV